MLLHCPVLFAGFQMMKLILIYTLTIYLSHLKLMTFSLNLSDLTLFVHIPGGGISWAGGLSKNATPYVIGLRFAILSCTGLLSFQQPTLPTTQHLHGCSAAHVVVYFVSSEILKCRLLKCLLAHPMNYNEEGCVTQS